MATQILPILPSPFMQDSPYSSEMFPHFTEYGNMNTADFQFYQVPNQTQQHYPSNSHNPSPEVRFSRRSSQSPAQQIRLPRSHDRATIQRHRSSLSRRRSHNRADALVSQRNEQDPSQSRQFSSQAVLNMMPTPSASTTPQIFSLKSYGMPITSRPGLESSSYFPSLPPAHQTRLVTHYGYQSEQELQQSFLVAQPDSQTSIGMIPDMSIDEDIYTVNQNLLPPATMPSLMSGISSFPPVQTLESTPAEFEIAVSRPKPQCWEHGCNGRQFSTFSNLLRHQREKSGNAMKALCPHCGTEFTRTTARNGHMYGGKCKGRPDHESSGGLSSSELDMEDV